MTEVNGETQVYKITDIDDGVASYTYPTVGEIFETIDYHETLGVEFSEEQLEELAEDLENDDEILKIFSSLFDNVCAKGETKIKVKFKKFDTSTGTYEITLTFEMGDITFEGTFSFSPVVVCDIIKNPENGCVIDTYTVNTFSFEGKFEYQIADKSVFDATYLEDALKSYINKKAIDDKKQILKGEIQTKVPGIKVAFTLSHCFEAKISASIGLNFKYTNTCITGIKTSMDRFEESAISKYCSKTSGFDYGNLALNGKAEIDHYVEPSFGVYAINEFIFYAEVYAKVSPIYAEFEGEIRFIPAKSNIVNGKVEIGSKLSAGVRLTFVGKQYDMAIIDLKEKHLTKETDDITLGMKEVFYSVTPEGILVAGYTLLG